MIRGVAHPGAGQQVRRPQWRGERRAVLIRLPVKDAEALVRAARAQQRSVSDHAAALLTASLHADGAR